MEVAETTAAAAESFSASASAAQESHTKSHPSSTAVSTVDDNDDDTADNVGDNEEIIGIISIGSSSSSNSSNCSSTTAGPVTSTAAVPTSNILDNADESLASLFFQVFRIYSCRFREESIITTTSSSSSTSEDGLSCLSANDRRMTISELRCLLSRVAFFVERLSLFSPNEELEDIHTSDLMFLLVPFLLAELSSHADIRENRKQNLENSLIYWKQFLHSMEALKLCSKINLKVIKSLFPTAADVADADVVAEGSSKHSDSLGSNRVFRRSLKISSYNEHKELEEKIQYLMQKKKNKLGIGFMKWGSEEVDDELERSLILCILRRSINESIEHLSIANQEIELLSYAAAAAAGGADVAQQQQQSSDYDRSLTSNYTTSRKPMILRINDPTELRILYLQKVFKPFHELPSISLAEVAAWEMEVEVKQLGAEDRRKSIESRRKKLLDLEEQGGEAYRGAPIEASSSSSEDEKEENYNREKQRAWDDWKDENPRGSGNKNRNIG